GRTPPDPPLPLPGGRSIAVNAGPAPEREAVGATAPSPAAPVLADRAVGAVDGLVDGRGPGRAGLPGGPHPAQRSLRAGQPAAGRSEAAESASETSWASSSARM